ncbi:putative retrotransposon nucleocapsid protein, partial [Puccinia sorghi]
QVKYRFSLLKRLQESSLYAKLLKYNPSLFTEQASKEFDSWKKSFTTAPILAHFSELAQNLIETDASDYAVAGIISYYIILNSTTRFMKWNFWQLFFAYRSGVHTSSFFQNLSTQKFLLADRLDGLNFCQNFILLLPIDPAN